MSPAAAPRGRAASSGHLSIGQVLARLTPEFPHLSASKLRYFEEQGLVTPLRTDAGYRKFSPSDVARVRTALTLQRDHDFKLARIREYLDAHDGEIDVARLLLQEGADPTIKNQLGLTAADFARKAERDGLVQDIVRALQQQRPNKGQW